MNKDLTLQVHPEGAPLVVHPDLELFVRHTAPGFEKSVHLLSVQSVAHVGGLTCLALVDTEVEPPSLDDGLEPELVRFLCEEAIQATLLLFLHSFELTRVVNLRFDCHIHLN